MKFLFVGTFLFLLYITVVFTEDFKSSKKLNLKEADKLVYPKKVNYVKKNVVRTSLKKITDITDKFRDLPADDLEFIKELDRQFKLHGGKFKIKVENINGTESKNSKRTIDGELGYGYAHNGYQYNPPKFMFYPYSQQNIGSNTQNYLLAGVGKTEVSIEPSYSYELQSQAYITHNEPQIDVPKSDLQQYTENSAIQQHSPQKQQQYEEPVIVLRIPGPAKYASHLQMLLQKYLEIRAAQYLHILEEAEQRNNKQQIDYGDGSNAIADGHIKHVEHQNVPSTVEQNVYTQQIQQNHQNAITAQPVEHPDVDNVYHNYKNRHSPQNENAQEIIQNTQPYHTPQQNEKEQYEYLLQQQQHQYQEEFIQYQQKVEEQPQYYYAHQQQYAQPEGPPANTYHQIYLISMAPQTPASYAVSQGQSEEPQAIYVQAQPNQNTHILSLPIAENNPRASHTKVIFTNKNEHTTHDYQMQQLPSIKPHERHAPTSTPDYHQDFQDQQLPHFQRKQSIQESSANDQQHNIVPVANPEVVAITQRPYNYHAHNVRAKTTHSRRAAMKEADKDLQKIRQFVRDKLGAEKSTAIEFKTTQVAAG